MNGEEALRYYRTMENGSLRRLLGKPGVPESQKDAIAKILRCRDIESEREQELAREIERSRPKKKKAKAQMFNWQARLIGKNGKILQGGRVNPR